MSNVESCSVNFQISKGTSSALSTDVERDFHGWLEKRLLRDGPRKAIKGPIHIDPTWHLSAVALRSIFWPPSTTHITLLQARIRPRSCPRLAPTDLRSECSLHDPGAIKPQLGPRLTLRLQGKKSLLCTRCVDIQSTFVAREIRRHFQWADALLLGV